MVTDTMLYTLMALVGASTVLLLLCAIYLRSIAARLGRADHLGSYEGSSRGESILQKVGSSSRESRSGAFARFMSERPELAESTKSEQFAAFRKWRKEQGLNWEGR